MGRPLVLLTFFASLVLPQAGLSQTTHTVCPAGPPTCDYASPETALADTVDVISGDTLDIQTDTYVLNSTLLVDRGLTLNFNDSVVDANGQRAVAVDGGSINDASLSNLADNGVSNFAPGPPIPYGQTFTSTVTELLTAFEFAVRIDGTLPETTITGSVRSGGRTGPIIAGASATFGPVSFGQIIVRFELDQPVALVLGDTYAVEFTPTSSVSILQAANPYADGNGYNDIDLSLDYAFSVIGGLPVAINDAVIRNGQAPAGESGGAVLVTGNATLTLDNAVLEGSAATSGGGLANLASNVTVTGGAIRDNRAGDQGAGAYTSGANAQTSLADVDIRRNRAGIAGGGVAALGGATVGITGSTVVDNAVAASAPDLDFLADSGSSTSCPGGGVLYIGQTFVAGIEALTSFTIRVRRTGFPSSDQVLTGQVRAGGPAGPVVASAEVLYPAASLATGSERDVIVELPVPVPLLNGDIYAVEIPQSDAYTVLLSSASYADGSSYVCTTSLDPGDLAFSTAGGAIGLGGGLFAEGVVGDFSLINASNSTIARNVGDGGYASALQGWLNTAFVTVTENSGNGLAAEVGTPGSQLSLNGVLLAGNGGSDCSSDGGSIASLNAANLIGDATGCTFTAQPDDLLGSALAPIDPLLGPLADNGGPTQTYALLPGSPAIDAAVGTCDATVDQRGVPRPAGPECDIGAYEGAPFVQGLIDAAASGALIDLPDGIYNEAITIGDGKTLQGSGPGSVVIDATGLNTSAVTITGDATLVGVLVTGGDNSRGGGIAVEGAGPFTVVLQDLRVVGNNADDGGGIYVRSGGNNVTMTNIVVENNTAAGGGGIFLNNQTVATLNNVQVIGNTATVGGGGIWIDLATAVIGTGGCSAVPTAGTQTNIIANNTVTGGPGGGIYARGATLTMVDTRITDNDALEGGGIFSGNLFGNLDVDCSVIDQNQAGSGPGGGISGLQGAVGLAFSRLASNIASDEGGAIHAPAGFDVVVTNSVLESNSAGAGGGAIDAETGFSPIGFVVSNSTLSNNFSGSGDGGAIRSTLGTLNSTNNTFRNNTSNASGGAVSADTLVSDTDVFEENSARNGGGAITINAPGTGQMQLLNGLLQNNTAGQAGGPTVSGRGGALEFLGGIGLIEDTLFLNNTALETGDDLGQGGAIYTTASLELIVADTTISGSLAGFGGGVYNTGILSVARSTLFGNTAGPTSGSPPRGGAIASTDSLEIVNSTISGNVVNPGPGNSGDGGAIAVLAGSTATLNNVTVAFNRAPNGGALYAEPSGAPLEFSNSLFFDNEGPLAVCDPLASLGYNIYDATTCATAATDIVGDALIGLLADNGGLTQTHALLSGSPALDNGGPVRLAFGQFDNLDRFSTQGSAVLDGISLLLAGSETAGTAGSAYLSDPVDVSTSFTAQFDFQINPGSGGSASDGITFSFSDDPTFLGDGGGTLGIGAFDTPPLNDGLYVPSGPQLSGVSIEFDTWPNGEAEGANDGQTSQEHVGINLDGSLSSAALTGLGPAGTLSNGSVWTAWVDYDANTNLLEVRASNTGSRPAAATVSLTVDILAETDADADGNVYVGFTGAAGAGTGIGGFHRIRSFEFTNVGGCEPVDQRGVTRPAASGCDIGAFEANAIPATIDNAELSVNTATTPPGVVDVSLIDIPIEKLAGDGFNAPESAPLSSFPLSSFPLSSLDLRASPLSSFPLSSLPLSSLNVTGAPLSSFPLSSLPLLSVPGGWAAVIADIPSLAGAPLQTVTLQDVVQADSTAIEGITLQSLAIQDAPLSSLSLPAVALGEAIDVAILDDWLASEGLGAVCATLAAEGFTDCAPTDTYASLEIRSAPLSSLPLSSLPLSSFPLSSFPLSSFPLSSLPLSSFPLSSFPLSSFPLSSLPLSSFPLSSLPLSSLPLSSFPLSSLDLLAAPLSSLPLSSFPLSSLPLSSLEVGGESFCAFYDAAAAASGEQSCAGLGLDPASQTLGDLIVALAAAGEETLASTPLSSLPLSSLDIADAPLSSFQLDFADVAGAPLSSFPLSSLPLSSLPLSSLGAGGSSFCVFWDAAAIDAGQDTCADLSVSDASNFGDLIAGLLASGETTFAATPLSSFPLSSLPLSSLPLSSFPLSSLEINGAPLSSFPLSSFDLASSPLSSLPLSSLPLSSFGTVLACASPCEGFGTLGEAWVGGILDETAPLETLFDSSEFLALTYGDLTASLSLEYLFGTGTLGGVADFGELTFGQLLLSLILRSDFPWETIPLADLDLQSFAADHFVSYSLDFQVNGTAIEPVTVSVELGEGFYVVPGSARFATRPQSGGALAMTALPDPVSTLNGDGTQKLTFAAVDPGAFSDNMLEFITVPPLSLGAYAATAELALGAAPAQAADAAGARVSVQPSAVNDASDLALPALTTRDTLILGHIDAPDDIDYFLIDPPPEGSRVSVFMANPGSDNDLAMYEPVSAVEAKGQLAEGPSPGSVPFEDDGVNYAGNETEEPDALEDVNLAAAPLSSLSTNRGDSNELVSSIGDGVNPFTIQVSGYNSAVSPEPYTLRVRVVPEVPATQCTPRSWPFQVPSGRDFTPAGDWTPATSAVFLVNWDRLAASDPGGAAAANQALNAVNALVNAPGIVDGVVVDVATIPGADYGAWDADPCDPNAANSVVNAITAWLEDQRAIAQNLAYVTIVGSDEVIPFARKSDETTIANESTFAGEFSDNAMFGTHLTRNFLSDDTYGDIDPIPWLDRWLNVPELAVGRLVESAADIRTAADNYVISGGVLTPLDAVSAGYDFIFDASSDIQETFGLYGLNSTPLLDPPVKEVVGSDGTVTFQDNQGNVIEPWDRAAFLAATGLASSTQAVSDLVSFNMHFDFDEALPSSGDAAGNYSDNLINVADLDGNDLTGRLWFTVGCHSGTSVADISVTSGGFSTDWPQKLNELGAVYIGQAAYGLGDTVALALTERLLANFARNLGRTIPVADGAGAGLPITAGQAHAFAKQDYFADLGLYGEYDFKALQASVYFGLPMYRVELPVRVDEPLPPLRTVQNDPVSNLASVSLSIAPVIDRETTEKGEYFSVDGDAQFIHYRPLQPIVSTDVTSATGEIARGAFITALTTEDLIIEDIAFARPVVDLGELEPEIETAEVIFPTTFASVSSYRVPADPGPFEERQQLNLIVGQYTKFAEQDFGTQRLFNSVDVEVFYEPAAPAPKSLAAGAKTTEPDDIRPELDNIRANVIDTSGPLQATFSVDATDAVDALGTPGQVRRVAVLYRQSVDASGQAVWVLEDLVKGTGDTWTGGGPVDATGLVDDQVDYLVQAVDASGNVANSTFKGLFYAAERVAPPPPAPQPGGAVDIELTVDGQPVANPAGWITTDPVIVQVSDLAPGVVYEFALDSPIFEPLTTPSITVSGDGLHVVTVREVGGSNPVTFPVLIDTTIPAIVLSVPKEGQFIEQGEAPLADFECLDAGSGVQACSGTVAKPAPVPDQTTGEVSFMVSSLDFAGLSNAETNEYFVLKQLDLTGPSGPQSLGSSIFISGSGTDLADFAESATINWGDGSSEPLTLLASGDTFTFEAMREYAATGTYTITVSVDYGNAYRQIDTVDVSVFGPVGLWAQGGNDRAVEWSGSGGTVEGLVQSNGGIRISGSNKRVEGATRYVEQLDVSGANLTFAVPPEKIAAAPWPFDFDLDDYKPGGAVAEAAGAGFKDLSDVCASDGRWRVTRDLDDGLYWVPCDVQLSGSGVRAQITILSTGTIMVSGSQHQLSPYVDGVLLWAESGDGRRAIQLSGSGSSFGGYLLAPRGGVQTSGSNTPIGCGIAAQRIRISGGGRIVGQDCAVP